MPLHTRDAVLTRRSLCFKYRKHSSGRAGPAMTHPHRPGEVSSHAPHFSSRSMHVLWCALSPAVCLVCCVRWCMVEAALVCVRKAARSNRQA